MAIGLLFSEDKVRRLFVSHSAFLFLEREVGPVLTLSFKKMRGIRTLARFRVESERTICIEGELLEGRYQVVALSKERTILLYDSALPSVAVPTLPEGLYRLRLLADKATGSLLIKSL